jgi:hypothetical protein
MTAKNENGAGNHRGKDHARAGSPPTYFLSLRLQNARCFGAREQTLDLSDGKGRPAQWTILLGENGTGKTTVLQALVLLGLAHDPSSPSEIDPFRAFLWRQTQGFRRTSGTVTRLAATVGLGTKFTDQTSLPRQKAITAELKPGEIFAGGPAGPHAPFCYAYGASRRLGTSALTEQEEISSTASLFSDRVELMNAEEWLLRLDYSASKTSKLQRYQKRRLDQVKRLLIDILPGVYDIAFTDPTKAAPTPGVEFDTDYGRVPLRQLGYGYQTLIAWMVDFASRMVDRYPDCPNPLAEPAVVLVDEIDLHLHPTWQRRLIGYLTERFPNTQFIVTAHSPLIVQAAGDANLVLLRRERDHVVIDKAVKAIRGWRIDQVLTSDLFGLPSARPPEFDDLLEERDKILSKARLTSADKKRLAKLEARIGELPVGESASQREALSLVQQTIELLKKHQAQGQ